MSFRLKTIVGIAFIEAVLLAMLIYSSLGFLRDSNERTLKIHADTTAQLFATTTTDAVLSTDLAALESFVGQVLTNPELEYARVLDEEGRVLAEGGNELALQHSFTSDSNLKEVDDSIFDVRADIVIAGERYGRVEIGLGISRLQTLLVEARQHIGILAAVEMVLVALFSLLLGTYLTRQLEGLREASNRLANGELGYQIPLKGKDELAQVTQSFNAMSRRLKTQNIKERAILETAIDGIIVCDGHSKITEFNGAASTIFGINAEHAVGKKLTETIIPSHMHESHFQGMQRYLQTGEAAIIDQRVELMALHASGCEFPIELSVSAIEFEGQPHFIGFIRDITDRKRAEQMLQEQNAALETSNRELQDFAYVASHDLQEPLRKIQAFGDRLVTRYQDQLDERGKDYLARMRNAASRMQSLIEDLLAFSRVTTKSNPFETISLAEISKEVISNLETSIEDNQAHLVIGELHTIEADPVQLRQVLQNLLGNSLKYRKKEVSPLIKIAGAYENGGKQYRLTVEDNGVGFDNKYAERIFGIFERLHGRSEVTGTGVGLAIVRKIIDRHNGSISAVGMPGEGAKFTVILPVKQTPAKSVDFDQLQDTATQLGHYWTEINEYNS